MVVMVAAIPATYIKALKPHVKIIAVEPTVGWLLLKLGFEGGGHCLLHQDTAAASEDHWGGAHGRLLAFGGRGLVMVLVAGMGVLLKGFQAGRSKRAWDCTHRCASGQRCVVAPCCYRRNVPAGGGSHMTGNSMCGVEPMDFHARAGCRTSALARALKHGKGVSLEPLGGCKGGAGSRRVPGSLQGAGFLQLST